MPNTACEGGNMTKLFKMVSDQFSSSVIATVQRKYFNETKGICTYTVYIVAPLIVSLLNRNQDTLFHNYYSITPKRYMCAILTH